MQTQNERQENRNDSHFNETNVKTDELSNIIYFYHQATFNSAVRNIGVTMDSISIFTTSEKLGSISIHPNQTASSCNHHI